MKKLIAILLAFSLCFILVACDGGEPTEEERAEALALGQQLYGAATAATKRGDYQYISYDNSSQFKRFVSGEHTYNEATDFFDKIGAIFSDDAIISLKTQMGMLITADSASGERRVFIRMFDNLSLYSHTVLELVEITKSRYTFAATAYYFTSEGANAQESEPSVTETTTFIVAKGYELVIVNGEEVKQTVWRVIQFEEPWHYPFTVLETEPEPPQE